MRNSTLMLQTMWLLTGVWTVPLQERGILLTGIVSGQNSVEATGDGEQERLSYYCKGELCPNTEDGMR